MYIQHYIMMQKQGNEQRIRKKNLGHGDEDI